MNSAYHLVCYSGNFHIFIFVVWYPYHLHVCFIVPTITSKLCKYLYLIFFLHKKEGLRCGHFLYFIESFFYKHKHKIIA